MERRLCNGKKNIKKENPGYFLRTMPLHMHDRQLHNGVWCRCGWLCGQNIAACSTGLKLNGSTFAARAVVNAKVKASISITMTLQRQSGTRWSDVTSWFDSTTGYNLDLTKNYVAGTRGNYRVRAVYTVNGETITTYSSTVTY